MHGIVVWQGDSTAEPRGETRLEIGCETAGDVKRVVFIDVEDQRQSRQMLDRPIADGRGMRHAASTAARTIGANAATRSGLNSLTVRATRARPPMLASTRSLRPSL